MAVTIKALHTAVKYKGVFDLKRLYRDLVEFMKDIDYTDQHRYKWLETYYYEKRSSDPHEAKTMWIWLRTFKKDELAGSAFYKQRMNMDIRCRFLKDIEIMVDGQKTKAQKGEIEVSIRGDLILDRYGYWENHWFLKHFLKFFYQRVWKKQREAKKNAVTTDVYKVQNYLKDVLELMHSKELRGEIFYPKYGLYAKY